MAWEIVDEHLDQAEGLHRIIYENKASLSIDGKPERLERVIFLKREECPYCGHVTEKTAAGEIDVPGIKQTTLAALKNHEAGLLEHAKKHRVPLLKPKGKP